MAGTSFWMTHVTPKSGDATQQRVMMFMPLIFVVFCYNFAAALALYYTTQNLFTILQLYQNRNQPLPKLEKVNQPAKRKGKGTLMSTDAEPKSNAKELLDTMLGYLGFVVEIEETRGESGNPTLQIYTEEADRLIGRDGETLDAVQFLLNRLLQAKRSRRAEVDRGLRDVSLDAPGQDRASREAACGAGPHLRPAAAARADEFLRAPHRARSVQG